MFLYHTLPTVYFNEQMRDDGFHCFWDRKLSKTDVPKGIWCCDNDRSSYSACQSPRSVARTMIEIDAREMSVENCGDFLNKNNGDYYILRETFIPKNKIHIIFSDPRIGQKLDLSIANAIKKRRKELEQCKI